MRGTTGALPRKRHPPLRPRRLHVSTVQNADTDCGELGQVPKRSHLLCRDTGDALSESENVLCGLRTRCNRDAHTEARTQQRGKGTRRGTCRGGIRIAQEGMEGGRLRTSGSVGSIRKEKQTPLLDEKSIVSIPLLPLVNSKSRRF